MTPSLLPSRRDVVAGLLASPVLALPGPALATGLPAPAGPVILTVTGAIGTTNAPGEARFDLAMLDALPQRETVTATPWHQGRPRFRGPTLAGLLAAVGARGKVLAVAALNDYVSEVPAEDAALYPVILATRMDGAGMSVRDKGPIFVIYPFDEHPELFNEVYFGRSVWQVRSIGVRA